MSPLAGKSGTASSVSHGSYMSAAMRCKAVSRSDRDHDDVLFEALDVTHSDNAEDGEYRCQTGPGGVR